MALELRRGNSSLPCHLALQYELLMGMTAHLLWDTSYSVPLNFSSGSLWLYNQHRAPLMMDSHNHPTLQCVWCVLSKCHLQTRPVSSQYVTADASFLFTPLSLTNGLLCGRQQDFMGNWNDEFKNLWLVFSFNPGSRGLSIQALN